MTLQIEQNITKYRSHKMLKHRNRKGKYFYRRLFLNNWILPLELKYLKSNHVSSECLYLNTNSLLA
jgi:hypothetical protein